jgi:hypothetical protein
MAYYAVPGGTILRSERSRCLRRAVVSAACAGVLGAVILGCRHSDEATPVAARTSPEATLATTTATPSPTCEPELSATYRTKGEGLTGDVDGDGAGDRVTLRVDEARPARCRYLLLVELSAGISISAPVRPLAWPGTDPEVLLLAEIDGRPGLEPVVALSPLAVYRPGALFTVRDGELARMRLERTQTPELFPFYDEFPAGVDCGREPGTIVVTLGTLAEGGSDDSHWDITRSLYRARGIRFEPVRDERFRVAVGPEAGRRWPEVRGKPFLSCPGRVS